MSSCTGALRFDGFTSGLTGATTVRTQVVGYDDRPPSSEELEAMRGLVRTAMEEGALGVGSSLIYPPAFFASTEELIELCRVASEYGGMYISHMRSEGDRLLEGVDELISSYLGKNFTLTLPDDKTLTPKWADKELFTTGEAAELFPRGWGDAGVGGVAVGAAAGRGGRARRCRR